MRLGIVVGLLLACAAAQTAPHVSGGPHFDDRRLTVNGKERRYLLYPPPARPAGLVLMLQGEGELPERAALDGQIEAAAARHLVLAVPESIDHAWNDGIHRQGTDDLAFLAALIDALVREFKLEPQRVYAIGFSNGGGMAFRLACELSEKVAAIATVAASMAQDSLVTCRPKRASAVLIIHGTADPIIPYAGGRTGGGYIAGMKDTAPLKEVAAFWRRRAGCKPRVAANRFSTLLVRESCVAGKSRVDFYSLEGGGHTWPGTKLPTLPYMGKVAPNFDATNVIFEFLAEANRANPTAPSDRSR